LAQAVLASLFVQPPLDFTTKQFLPWLSL